MNYFVVCCSVMSESLWPMDWSPADFSVLHCLPKFAQTCPLSKWCYPIISSSVAPFFSCPQSFIALESSPMSWLFASDGQNIGASTSASVLPVNIQCWFPCLSLAWILIKCPQILSQGLIQAVVYEDNKIINNQYAHFCSILGIQIIKSALLRKDLSQTPGPPNMLNN